MAASQRSPWVTIGCGCAVLLGLGVVAIAAFGIFGVRSLQQYAETMKDPGARDERARDILGAARLPAELNAQVYFRIPRLMEVVVLTDAPAVEGHQENVLRDFDQLFLFVAMRDWKGHKRDFERYLEGEVDHASALEDIDVDLDFRPETLLGRGALTAGSQEVRWVAHEGEVDTGRERAEGIMALAGVDCPHDERLRIAAWFMRDQRADVEDEAEAEERDLSSTPADPAALRALLDHFDVCGG